MIRVCLLVGCNTSISITSIAASANLRVINVFIIIIIIIIVLLVTSASDLPLRTKLCYAVFGVVVHAGCDKQDSLMR